MEAEEGTAVRDDAALPVKQTNPERQAGSGMSALKHFIFYFVFFSNLAHTSLIS